MKKKQIRGVPLGAAAICPETRSSRNCIAFNFLFQDPFWNVELWPLDADEMERRCDGRSWWRSTTIPATTASAGPRYWEHEVAVVESRSDLICLLVGVLCFRQGRWELRDARGSVELVASDGDCLQFRDRLVFSTSFCVHRETFTLSGGDATSVTTTFRRVYLTIEDFQPASMPLIRPEETTWPSRPMDADCQGVVRFLALNKSMPMSVYISQPAIRRAFGYLVLASIHSGAELPPGEEDAMAPKPAKRRYVVCSQTEKAGDPEGPAKCVFFFDHDHPGLGSPELIEGRVYVIRLPRWKLLTNPYATSVSFSFLCRHFFSYSGRISLPSLRDVPFLKDLKDQVFIVPGNVSVCRVAYNLPKSSSFTRHDVLRAADCPSLAEEAPGTAVSLRGRIVDRMHMDPLYASERTGHTFTTHRGTWLGIPGISRSVLVFFLSFLFGILRDLWETPGAMRLNDASPLTAIKRPRICSWRAVGLALLLIPSRQLLGQLPSWRIIYSGSILPSRCRTSKGSSSSSSDASNIHRRPCVSFFLSRKQKDTRQDWRRRMRLEFREPDGRLLEPGGRPGLSARIVPRSRRGADAALPSQDANIRPNLLHLHRPHFAAHSQSGPPLYHSVS